MDNWLQRTEILIGKDKLNKLRNSTVAVFGIGGVGSYVAEALVRSGIGHIVLIDNDNIDLTNINRQLIADTTSIGKSKVEIAKNRYLNINPNLIIDIYQEYYDQNTTNYLIFNNYDYIVDAIDSISSKLLLIEEAKKHNINIISCMGTGNKLNPTKFKIEDISKTTVCPLAKIIRKELKKRNIKNVKVLFSDETPIQFDNLNNQTIGSISFVPSVAGLIIASEVIKDLI